MRRLSFVGLGPLVAMSLVAMTVAPSLAQNHIDAQPLTALAVFTDDVAMGSCLGCGSRAGSRSPETE